MKEKHVPRDDEDPAKPEEHYPCNIVCVVGVHCRGRESEHGR